MFIADCVTNFDALFHLWPACRKSMEMDQAPGLGAEADLEGKA